MKKINACLEEQVNIIAKAELTMLFLKVYKNNPKEFYMLFDEKLIEELKYNSKNTDAVYEFCRSLADEIIEPVDLYFHMASNGIFSYIEYSKKLDKNLLDDIYQRFGPMANYAWALTSKNKFKDDSNF